jgi:hypothetical protein
VATAPRPEYRPVQRIFRNMLLPLPGGWSRKRTAFS